MNILGWLKKPHTFKHFSFEKSFGNPEAEEIKPLGRSISQNGESNICQGMVPSCVACTVTFIQQWNESQKGQEKPLSWQFLNALSGGNEDGAEPSEVLENARETGICEKEKYQGLPIDFVEKLNAANHEIPGYFFLEELSEKNIYAALKKGLVMIGVDDFCGSGPHMLAGYDVTDNGESVKCANWRRSDYQETVEIPFKQITFACLIAEPPEGLSKTQMRMPMLSVLKSKLSHVWEVVKKDRKFFGVLAATLGLVLLSIVAIPNKPSQESILEKKFGAAGIFDKYAPVITGSGISATDNFLPVSTLTLYTGETIASSDVQFPVTFIINPNGTTREKIECGALDAGGLKWTGCSRGLSAKCFNASSTVSGAAFPHSAGEQIIMSNDSCFFNRFLDTNTDQTATGTKRFSVQSTYFGNAVSSTNQRLVLNTGQGDIANPFLFAEGTSTLGWGFGNPANTFLFNTAGTIVGASTTKGIFLTNSEVGINASSTGGIGFDSNGLAIVNVSSTPSTNGGFLKYTFNALNQLYWDASSFLSGSWNWTGINIFNGTTTFSNDVLFTNSNPSTSTSIVNKQYVDISISENAATGTAGMAITAGETLYMSSTSTLFTAEADSANAYKFVGIALTSGSTGQEIAFSKPGGVNASVSGLTAGKYYYLSNAAGSLSATPGDRPVRVGIALSSNTIMVTSPSFRGVKTGSIDAVFNGSTYTATLGFIPTKVEFLCDSASPITPFANFQNTGAIGWWVANSDGSSQSFSYGTDNPNQVNYGSGGGPCLWTEGVGQQYIVSSFTTTTSGFSVTVNNIGGAPERQLLYTAYVDDTRLP